jgi:hypothetical protein
MQALKRHSVGVAFLASVRHKLPLLPKTLPRKNPTCQCCCFAVVSKLPIKRLTRATRGMGRASSPPSSKFRPAVYFILCAAKLT